jgi:hypothetical protein
MLDVLCHMLPASPASGNKIAHEFHLTFIIICFGDYINIYIYIYIWNSNCSWLSCSYLQAFVEGIKGLN